MSSKLTTRQKYWLYEVLSLIPILVVVLLFDSQPWWKYLVVGVCFGIYHNLQNSRDRS